MANPRGQQRDKPFRDALRMEIAAADDDQRALREIARNLILIASTPSKEAVGAIREIADRLDGKVPQGVIGGDGDEPELKVIHEIRRSIVDPGHKDSTGIPPATGAGSV